MPTPLECINQKANTKRVTRATVNEVTRLVQAYLATNPGASQSAAAMHALNKARQNFVMQRRQMRLTNAAMARVNTLVNAHAIAHGQPGQMVFGQNGQPMPKRSLAEYFYTMLSADPKQQIPSQFSTIEARWHHEFNMLQAAWDDGIDALRGRGFFRHQFDKATSEDLIHELFIASKGAGAGRQTNNSVARQIAGRWKIVDDYIVKSLKAVGANIVQRTDFIIPNFHDTKLVRGNAINISDRTAPDRVAWVNYIRDRIEVPISDVTGLPMLPHELDNFLHETWETIATDGWNQVGAQLLPHQPAPGQGRRAKMGQRHAFERRLQFKDAQSWLDYDARYGSRGDIFDSFLGHMKGRAREIAIMQQLGPAPDAVMGKMIELAKADNVLRGKDEANAWTDLLETDYNELYGRLSRPAEGWLGKILEAVRGYLPAAQLGGAMITSITDFGTTHVGARMAGLSASRIIPEQMRLWLLGEDMDHAVAMKLGIGCEDWVASSLGARRYDIQENAPRIARGMSDAVMRITGLTQKTAAARQAASMEFLREWGAALQAGHKYADLHPQMQRVLEFYGITPAEWSMLGSVAQNGGVYTHRGMPHLNLVEVAKANPEVAVRLSQAIQENVEAMVPAGTSTQRAISKGGLIYPGGIGGETLMGQGLRSVMQYKAFPILMLTNIVGRIFYSRLLASRLDRMQMFGLHFVELMALGYISMQAKQVLSGKKPVDINERPGQVALAAALQGGALGLYGDFLFADQNRFGGSFLQSLAGPTFGSVLPDTMKLVAGNAQELITGKESHAGRELVRYLRSYTPGSTVWQTRLLMDRAIWDGLQSILDPEARNSWAQQRAFQRSQYGTDYFAPPGELY